MKIKVFFGIVILAITIPLSASHAQTKTPSFEESIQKNQFIVPVSESDLKERKDASTLLISCVDFRLRHETEALMRSKLHLLDDYDEVAMPGASLALVQTDHPHWAQTLEDIVALVEKLHNIKRIILLDHRDCGAYKLLKGGKYTKTKEIETASHKETLLEAQKILEKKFPNLKVYTMLIGLDGVVENFHSDSTEKGKPNS
jgi:carbonic anhydrase-like protein